MSNEGMKWTLVIEDSHKAIDRNVIGLGSTFNISITPVRSAQHKDIIHGYCKSVETVRGSDGVMKYAFSGYDSVTSKKKASQKPKARKRQEK
jgi:hypothetical protein